jgi:hypothetical protein
MNKSGKSTIEDEDYITDTLEDITEEMSINLNKMDKDKWINIFVTTKDISAARNRKRFIRIFGVSLARSNPQELFTQAIFDGTNLLETKIASVWAAAYTLYGPGWLNATIDVGKYIAPTKLLKACTIEEIKNASPFHAKDIYEDNSDSLHNLESKMKKLCKVKVKSKGVFEPEDWAEAMTKQFKNSMVKKVCLRLAKTPLATFKELKLLNEKSLDKIAVTTIWAGAYILLGQIETNPNPNQSTPRPKPANTRTEEPT